MDNAVDKLSFTAVLDWRCFVRYRVNLLIPPLLNLCKHDIPNFALLFRERVRITDILNPWSFDARIVSYNRVIIIS